jgi:hypothetical protein
MFFEIMNGVGFLSKSDQNPENYDEEIAKAASA